jgi:hypothetical protein
VPDTGRRSGISRPRLQRCYSPRCNSYFRTHNYRCLDCPAKRHLNPEQEISRNTSFAVVTPHFDGLAVAEIGNRRVCVRLIQLKSTLYPPKVLEIDFRMLRVLPLALIFHKPGAREPKCEDPKFSAGALWRKALCQTQFATVIGRSKNVNRCRRAHG